MTILGRGAWEITARGTTVDELYAYSSAFRLQKNSGWMVSFLLWFFLFMPETWKRKRERSVVCVCWDLEPGTGFFSFPIRIKKNTFDVEWHRILRYASQVDMPPSFWRHVKGPRSSSNFITLWTHAEIKLYWIWPEIAIISETGVIFLTACLSMLLQCNSSN